MSLFENTIMNTPQHLIDFLKTPTPKTWCEYAANHLPILLIDHAHCERKAAASALQLISKNPHFEDLIVALSPIVREEMLHFEKVLELLKIYKTRLQPLAPSHYGKCLHKLRSHASNQDGLIDDLIIGAIIEARSCERFFALVPYLDEDDKITKFYKHLAVAEQRHFEVYLQLAAKLDEHIDKRIQKFIYEENRIISTPDAIFRFHSGPVI